MLLMHKIGLVVGVLGLVCGLVSVTAAGPAAGLALGGDRDCSDFDTQQEAQNFFESHNPGADPHGLDADNDGIACEDLPGGGGGGGNGNNGGNGGNGDNGGNTDRPRCKGANRSVSRTPKKKVREAVRCLVNVERTKHGREKLQTDGSLLRAAQSHSATMASTDCLAHRCPGEPDLEVRIIDAGYIQGGVRAWEYAESTGCGRTPQTMVTAWMGARYHRASILHKHYRDIGVGVVSQPVRPRCKPRWGTLTLLVGFRDR